MRCQKPPIFTACDKYHRKMRGRQVYYHQEKKWLPPWITALRPFMTLKYTRQEVDHMKKTVKKWLWSGSFTLGGAWVGLAMYYNLGCSSGLCSITSDPWITMGYMAVVGWLLSKAIDLGFGRGK